MYVCIVSMCSHTHTFIHSDMGEAFKNFRTVGITGRVERHLKSLSVSMCAYMYVRICVCFWCICEYVVSDLPFVHCNTYAYVHTYVHTVYTYIHIHIYTHILTHTPIYIQRGGLLWQYLYTRARSLHRLRTLKSFAKTHTHTHIHTKHTYIPTLLHSLAHTPYIPAPLTLVDFSYYFQAIISCMYVCMCVYVCMYVCMHVCMFVCWYVCIFVMVYGRC